MLNERMAVCKLNQDKDKTSHTDKMCLSVDTKIIRVSFMDQRFLVHNVHTL